MFSMQTKFPGSLQVLRDESKFVNIKNIDPVLRRRLRILYIYVWYPFDRICKCVRVTGINGDIIEYHEKGKKKSVYKTIDVNTMDGLCFIPIDSMPFVENGFMVTIESCIP